MKIVPILGWVKKWSLSVVRVLVLLAALLASAGVALADTGLGFSQADIGASRRASHPAGSLPAVPAAVFQGVDMANLLAVVEAGDHHVSLLDGDKLEPIHRFASREDVQGDPAFSPDGRYMFLASRDGWVSKFDIWNLQVVAQIRAAVETRNLALSGDGKYLAVANAQPNTLVLLDADLQLLKVLAVTDKNGKISSRVSAVHAAPARKSFVVALKDVAEVWEISYDPTAEDVAVGMVHDFQYKEGAFVRGFLNPRRSFLSEPLDDIFFTPSYTELLGTSRDSGAGLVLNLDVRRKIADLNLPGAAHLAAGITWKWQGKTVMATPSAKEALLTITDLTDWTIRKTLPTLGPGAFMHSQESTPYAWAGATQGPRTDSLRVIDKRTFEKVADITPDPGKALTHVALTRDGKLALVSVWEGRADGGALLVLDATTFKEIKRIPMDKPRGTFRLHKPIQRSQGATQ